MRNPVWTAVALAGVLTAGVGAAAVNSQISPVSAPTDTNLAFASSTSGYDGAGLVTDIAAFEAYPAPVVEIVEVVDPTLTVAATPQKSPRKAASTTKKKRAHAEPSDEDAEHEDEDEAEYEDD
jgi:hypothetical protein